MLNKTGPLAAMNLSVRINSIDAMRGLVMLIMLLDHVRERVFYHHQISDPMDVETTSPVLFFSRLLAHLCAPTFVFLTGLSAWLYQHKNDGSQRPVREFLITRGLILIALEFTLVTFSWMGSYHTIWLQVIWAIGVSMVVLGLIAHWHKYVLLALGLLIVCGHNALGPIQFSPGEWGYSLWTILHDRNFLIAEGPVRLKASYPVLPWIGVIILGYLAGPLYAHIFSSSQRATKLIGLGSVCLAAFMLLRVTNCYGETLPWQVMQNPLQTVMSFLNLTKYPPSLDFLLLTLGVMFFLLCWLEAGRMKKISNLLAHYGAAPMFFYLLHLYVLLVIYEVCVLLCGKNHGGYFGVAHMGWVWLIAAVLAVLLYWPTKQFALLKRKSSWRWVKYF
jgi:uncharacterized membrane protein